MRLLSLPIAVLALASSTAVQSAAVQPRDLLQKLQNQAILNLKAAANNSTLGEKGCSVFNAPARRDWNAMSAQERKAYISAVQCLFNSPSKSDPAAVPGARNRYDDFVAQHINQTLSIHATGNFLSWHRYFVYGYEKALKDECGYTGHQPYWNWFTHQTNLSSSPVFDGSETSMGGDGLFVQHNGSTGGQGTIYIPSGTGGGCVTSGPFADFSINLGPVRPSQEGLIPFPDGALAYNPRCPKRDLSSYAASTWLTFDNLFNITLGAGAANVATFQDELQGRFRDGFLGMHGAGHYAIGGEAGDLFASPVDPVFFMHHAMLDYVWWIWQALHLNQAKTVAGTITIGNRPPSRDARLDDLVEMNFLDIEPRTIKELLDTAGGEPMCYVYA